MWEADTMGLVDSLTVSLLGFLIVFLALGLLAMATALFSKNLALLGIGTEKISQTKNETKEDDVDEKGMAVIISAIAEEVRIPLDRFKITSIKEIQ